MSTTPDEAEPWTTDHPNVQTFLREIQDVCRRHGFSISHEDTHGAFQIVRWNQRTADWLADADINLDGT